MLADGSSTVLLAAKGQPLLSREAKFSQTGALRAFWLGAVEGCDTERSLPGSYVRCVNAGVLTVESRILLPCG
jgi:hypothetical protein